MNCFGECWKALHFLLLLDFEGIPKKSCESKGLVSQNDREAGGLFFHLCLSVCVCVSVSVTLCLCLCLCPTFYFCLYLSPFVCLYVCVVARNTHMRTHTRTHARMYTCTHRNTPACARIHTHTHGHTHMHGHTLAHTHLKRRVAICKKKNAFTGSGSPL